MWTPFPQYLWNLFESESESDNRNMPSDRRFLSRSTKSHSCFLLQFYAMATAVTDHQLTIGGVKVQFPVKPYPSQLSMMDKVKRMLTILIRI